MNKFDDRKNAFLKEHTFNEDQQFKIRNVANKKLATWVAGICSLTEDQQKQLTLNLIEKDIIQTGQTLVAQTAFDVLEKYGKNQSLEAIKEKIIAFTNETALEIKSQAQNQ